MNVQQTMYKQNVTLLLRRIKSGLKFLEIGFQDHCKVQLGAKGGCEWCEWDQDLENLLGHCPFLYSYTNTNTNSNIQRRAKGETWGRSSSLEKLLGQKAFLYKQARKPGRCNIYLRNLKLSLWGRCSGRRCYRIKKYNHTNKRYFTGGNLQAY